MPTCSAACADCSWEYTAEAKQPHQARNIAHLQGGLHLQEFPDHNVMTEAADDAE